MSEDNQSETCHVILQFFPDGSGWGPSAVAIPGTVISNPCPFVYTGTDKGTIEGLRVLAELIHQKSGNPTKLVRYESRVDLLTLGEE